MRQHSGAGRRRVWCSDRCRRRAADERRAAEAVGSPVRVEVVSDERRVEQLQGEIRSLRGRLGAEKQAHHQTRQELAQATRRLDKEAKKRRKLVEENRTIKEWVRRVDGWEAWRVRAWLADSKW